MTIALNILLVLFLAPVALFGGMALIIALLGCIYSVAARWEGRK